VAVGQDGDPGKDRQCVADNVAIGCLSEFYWNPSPSATPATGNSGGTSGTDLAYTAVGTKQLILIGVMTLRNAVINIDNRIGWLRMPDLYGSLIFVNKSGVAMVADGDADEIHVTLTPVIDNLQAAA